MRWRWQEQKFLELLRRCGVTAKDSWREVRSLCAGFEDWSPAVRGDLNGDFAVGAFEDVSLAQGRCSFDDGHLTDEALRRRALPRSHCSMPVCLPFRSSDLSSTFAFTQFSD